MNSVLVVVFVFVLPILAMLNLALCLLYGERLASMLPDAMFSAPERVRKRFCFWRLRGYRRVLARHIHRALLQRNRGRFVAILWAEVMACWKDPDLVKRYLSSEDVPEAWVFLREKWEDYEDYARNRPSDPERQANHVLYGLYVSAGAVLMAVDSDRPVKGMIAVSLWHSWAGEAERALSKERLAKESLFELQLLRDARRMILQMSKRAWPIRSLTARLTVAETGGLRYGVSLGLTLSQLLSKGGDYDV